MKLRALIERLEEIEEDLCSGLGDGVEAEVIAAIQPSYPLACSILGATTLDSDECDPKRVTSDGRPLVWIAIGGSPNGISPYAPRGVFEEARP